MFKSLNAAETSTTKTGADNTEALILQTALELFRERGFEVTTMWDIAHAAKVATGAAYYYFPSKEAIVFAYYGQVQRRHAERVREEWEGNSGLRARLGILLHSKLEILKDDRRFLGALFRYTGDPEHPLSVFGKGTQISARKVWRSSAKPSRNPASARNYVNFFLQSFGWRISG